MKLGFLNKTTGGVTEVGYVWADPLPADYTDITSITNIDSFWKLTNRDYKFARNEIKTLFEATTFAALSTDEKIVVSKLFLATPAERDTIYTTEQQVALGQLFNKNSVESRTLRVSKATSEVYNRLTKSEALQIVDDVTGANSLFFDYVNFGKEGTVEGDGEGLFDYVLSRVGTSYENTGFASYAFVPIGYANMADFATDLMVILNDGIY